MAIGASGGARLAGGITAATGAFTGTCEAAQYDISGTALDAQRVWNGNTTGTGAWVAAHAKPCFFTKITVTGASQRVFFTNNGTSTGTVLFGTSAAPIIVATINDSIAGVSTASGVVVKNGGAFALPSTSYITLECYVVTTSVAQLASTTVNIWAISA